MFGRSSCIPTPFTIPNKLHLQKQGEKGDYRLTHHWPYQTCLVTCTHLEEKTMVSSIMTSLISFLDPKFQIIAVSLRRHLYATISHLKANHIVYVMLPL